MEQLMYNANETIWMACMLLVAGIYIVLGVAFRGGKKN